MPIRWTSRKSLTEELDRLHGMRLDVYNAIKNWPDPAHGPTREQLAKHLGKKESSICGRVHELLGWRKTEHGRQHFPELVCIAIGPEVTNSTGKGAESLIALAWHEETFTPSQCAVDDSGQLDFFPAVHTPCKPNSGAFQ